MPDTVLDTTVLSNFAVIDHLNLLQQHYEQRACTTVAVIEEIQRGIDSGYQTLQPILEAAGIVDGEKWLPVLSVGEKEQEVYTHGSDAPLARENRRVWQLREFID